MGVRTVHRGPATRPLLGFRRRPGRLALFVFRLPLPLYRTGGGWLLGHLFLVLTHAGRRTGRPHDTAAMVLAALSLLVSTSYHLGYSEYRDADLRSPVIGTALGNSAAVLTGNPVGAFVTHTAAHVTAVVHQYEGGPTHMLPPTEDD